MIGGAVGDLEWGVGDTKDFGGSGVASGRIEGAVGDLGWGVGDTKDFGGSGVASGRIGGAVGDLGWGVGDTKDFGGSGVVSGRIGGTVGDLEWYLRGAFGGDEILVTLGAWATLASVRRWLGGRFQHDFCCCSQLARLWVPFEANSGKMPSNTNFGPKYMFWSTVCQVFVERGGFLATELGLLPRVKGMQQK
jgi:hypothetical protein